jgi:hypothetical protein
MHLGHRWTKGSRHSTDSYQQSAQNFLHAFGLLYIQTALSIHTIETMLPRAGTELAGGLATAMPPPPLSQKNSERSPILYADWSQNLIETSYMPPPTKPMFSFHPPRYFSSSIPDAKERGVWELWTPSKAKWRHPHAPLPRCRTSQQGFLSFPKTTPPKDQFPSSLVRMHTHMGVSGRSICMAIE